MICWDWWISLLLLFVSKSALGQNGNRNVLFLIGESMRPDDLDTYFGVEGLTPNFHRLFHQPRTVVVEQFHVDYPMCNPSRTSILLGRSPDVTLVKTNFINWNTQPKASEWKSLPALLKDNGWYTMSGGKIFHRGTNDLKAWDRIFDASDDINEAECSQDRQAERVPLDKTTTMPLIIGCRTPSNNVPDLNIAKKATAELKRFSDAVSQGKIPADKSFAMFVGFHLPHFPIRVNNRFLVSRTLITPLIPQDEPARNASEFLNEFSFDSPKPRTSSAKNDPDRSQIPRSVKGGTAFTGGGARRMHRESLRWLHVSGVRQVDASLGMILDGLEANGYANNTLILFVSDHSVGLGETRVFEKDVPLDIATRVPFAIHVPWMTTTPVVENECLSNINNNAVYTSKEFFMNGVDIYRTLIGFLGSVQLESAIAPSTNGRDLSGYLTAVWKSTCQGMPPQPPSPSTVAYSQIVRCSNPYTCRGNLKGTDVVGYTARTSRWRYVVYMRAVDGKVSNYSRENVITEELYDHSEDDKTIFNPDGANFIGHEFSNAIITNPNVAADMFQLVTNEFESLFRVVNASTPSPSGTPSLSPSLQPTFRPSRTPSMEPTKRPRRPSRNGEDAPSDSPTAVPSVPAPSKTESPSVSPANTPSTSPVVIIPGHNGDTPSPTSARSVDNEESGMNSGTIVVVVVVPIVVIAIIILGVVFLVQRRQRPEQQQTKEDSNESPGFDDESGSFGTVRRDTRLSLGEESTEAGVGGGGDRTGDGTEFFEIQ